MNQLIGVILVGGQSRRMGADKSALIINGKTMLAHMFATLAHTQVEKILVIHNPKQTFNCSEFSNEEKFALYIADMLPNHGPLSGIHSALVHYPDADLLVLPVDMPLISATSLNTLILSARKQNINARFAPVRPFDSSGKIKSSILPLYIHNNSELPQKLAHTLLHTNNFSVYHFCSLFPILEIAVENERELTNLNYPEQLSQI